MSPRKPAGRPRGRPPGRAQPKHRVTPVWHRQIDQDRHAMTLLRIAMHHLEHTTDSTPKDTEKGGDYDEEPSI
ncbi:hypothetical protein [Nesterenkonia flava]|uniref:Uncharacterized protein n=1 Tax=Nesterenkonia flava TaxID=469799 RepID=A0ABU1FTR2_9MICC|nr:hypothetical protein [Nesterenkonia flava]MDR5712040.1 hypothetical protein [Nesterenkonia flava]